MGDRTQSECKATEVDEHTALVKEKERGSACEIFYSSPVGVPPSLCQIVTSFVAGGREESDEQSLTQQSRVD
jgi:hypothetical protein